MIVNAVVCDVCERTKGAVNHWFKVDVDTDGIFTCIAMEHEDDHELPGKDVCGQECATKLFQRFLATGKLEAE